MVKISKEAKVGLTVLVGFVFLIWGLNFLKGKGIFVMGQKYYGVYNRVDGLTESSPIFYKGFKIGSVREITFNEAKQNILVSFTMSEKVSLPKNSVAQIYSLDLMGTKGIRFLYGDSPVLLIPGDTLKTSVAGDLADQVSQEVLPLKNKAENLVVKIDSLLTNINSLFDDQNKAGIAQGMRSFGEAMKNLEGTTAGLNHSFQSGGSLSNTLANLDSFTTALNGNAKEIEGLMTNLNLFSSQLKDVQIDSLANQMNVMISGVNGIFEQMNDGEGSLGKLLNDEELYNNLNEASISLDRLLKDVRHQPGRYVHFSAVNFGSKKVEEQESEDVVFKVQLRQSKTPLDIRGKQIIDGYHIYEDQYGKYYVYTIGEDKNLSLIEDLKDHVQADFPDAHIIALQNGRPIKLSKVLK